MSGVFATRYLADKERKTNSFFSNADHIVKVDGGYAIMNEMEYQKFKKQK